MSRPAFVTIGNGFVAKSLGVSNDFDAIVCYDTDRNSRLETKRRAEREQADKISFDSFLFKEKNEDDGQGGMIDC